MTDTASAALDHDGLTRFLILGAGVRGVRVHLQETWRQIRAREDYPAAAAELLGEACAAAALLTGHTKVDGRLSLQLQSRAAIRTLFAECTGAGTLRGIVQLSDQALPTRNLQDLGADAVLAITVENPRPGARGAQEPMRYQGLVSLASETLAGALEDYFIQSEQLPTRLLLVADENRAAGLMLQKLPGDEGDVDGWNRACALFDTLRSHELLDLAGDTLLERLFHQDGVEVLGRKPLEFACSCSRERVASMLASLGADEARAAVIDGQAEVRCEFCGQRYSFDPADVERLLALHGQQMAAPERVQ
ncbi:Hsp33 family molecular chaperone HslO [Lysobacter sp. A3-1-A15]|uniref:Hsp33 family molecular chaperone HslO n=1 Tax=Novilysobacter viscosus TaxID=3098602 RepID=UPI002EDB4012